MGPDGMPMLGPDGQPFDASMLGADGMPLDPMMMDARFSDVDFLIDALQAQRRALAATFTMAQRAAQNVEFINQAEEQAGNDALKRDAVEIINQARRDRKELATEVADAQS
jgi:hypothetical protein